MIGAAGDERPYLMGVAGEHVGRGVPLEGVREIVLGRAKVCGIRFVLDLHVSRRHAKLTIDKFGRPRIEDLGGKNGTVVNDAVINEPTLLQRGDRIILNDATVFRLNWMTDMEWALWRAAVIDERTECFRSSQWDVRHREMFDVAKRRGAPLALIMLDIDRFGAVNKTHGYDAGNTVLHQVASVIRERATQGDSDGQVFRWGGEEFCVLLPGTDGAAAVRVAEEIRAAIEALVVDATKGRIPVTLSGGVVALDFAPFDTPDLFFKAAAASVQKAKTGGRNRVVRWSPRAPDSGRTRKRAPQT